MTDVFYLGANYQPKQKSIVMFHIIRGWELGCKFFLDLAKPLMHINVQFKT